MPRIEIRNSTIGLQPREAQIQTSDLGASISGLANSALTFKAQQNEEARVARDNMFIATKSIEATDALINLEKELTTGRKDYNGYANDYVDGAAKIYQQILDEAPSAQAEEVLYRSFAADRNALYTKASNFEKVQLQAQYEDQALAAFSVSSNQLLTDPTKYQSVINATDNTIEALKATLPPEVISEITQKRDKLIAGTFVSGLIRQDPEKARDTLEAGRLDSRLTPEQKLGFLEASERAIASREAQAKAELSAIRTREVEQTKLDYYDGKITEADIRSNPNLDAGDVLSILKSGEENLRKQQQLASDVTSVYNFQQGFENPDPSNDSVVKTVSSVYDKVVSPEIDKLPPSAQLGAKVDFVNRTKVIPTSLLTKITGNLASGSANDVVATADLAVSLMNTNPGVSEQFSAATRAKAVTVSLMKEAGLTNNQILSYVNTPPLVEGSSEYITRQNLLASKEFEVQSDWWDTNFFALVGEPGDFFGTNPPVPDSVKLEYQRIVHAVGTASPSLDVDQLAEVSKKILLSTVGKSPAAGNKVMRYPPEKVYAIPGVDESWVEEVLHSDYLSAVPNGDTDDIILTNSSAATIGKAPTYNVSRINELGFPEVVLKDWTPKLSNYKGTKISEAVQKQKDLVKSLERERASMKASQERHRLHRPSSNKARFFPKEKK